MPLVLTRKEKQSIVIGEGVVITINRVRGKEVSVCIDAPKEVRVMRSELVRKEAA
jgi:carbon storage regulator